MARKRYGLTETRIARYIKEGRGFGTGPDYKPWFTVADVPSRGRSHRFFCPKVGREVHLLSDNEYFAFLLLWWDDEVIDIREQFPLLDRKETFEIATLCGVEHPIDRWSGTLWVNSTDLLATRIKVGKQEYTAYAIKEASALKNNRNIEKLEIERMYWRRRNVDWVISTNQQLKNTFTTNLSWILDPRNESSTHTDTHDIDEALLPEILRAAQESPKVPIRHLCLNIDRQLGVMEGTVLGSLRRLLGKKRILVNLRLPKLQDLPAAAYSLNKEMHKLIL